MSDVITKIFPDRGINCNTVVAGALMTGRYSVYSPHCGGCDCINPSGFFNKLDNRLDDYQYYGNSEASITPIGGNDSDGSGTSELVLDTPNGAKTGDLLVAVIVSSTSTYTLTPPAGWDLRHSISNTFRSYVLTKIIEDGDPSSYTFDLGGTITTLFGRINGYRNVDTAYDVVSSMAQETDTSSTSGSTNIYSMPIENYISNSLILRIATIFKTIGTATITVPSGYSEEANTTAADNRYRIGIFSQSITNIPQDELFITSNSNVFHSCNLILVPKNFLRNYTVLEEGFETDTGIWTLDTGIVRDTQLPHSGSYSLRVTSSNPSRTTANMSANFSIGSKGGFLSFYYRATAPAFLWIHINGQIYSLYRNGASVWGYEFTTDSRAWTRYSIPLAPGNNSVVISFSAIGNTADSGYAHIDDMQIIGYAGAAIEETDTILISDAFTAPDGTLLMGRTSDGQGHIAAGFTSLGSGGSGKIYKPNPSSLGYDYSQDRYEINSNILEWNNFGNISTRSLDIGLKRPHSTEDSLYMYFDAIKVLSTGRFEIFMINSIENLSNTTSTPYLRFYYDYVNTFTRIYDGVSLRDSAAERQETAPVYIEVVNNIMKTRWGNSGTVLEWTLSATRDIYQIIIYMSQSPSATTMPYSFDNLFISTVKPTEWPTL